MTEIRSDVEAELMHRNPIDEPRTEAEQKLSQDAHDAICERHLYGVQSYHVKSTTLKRAPENLGRPFKPHTHRKCECGMRAIDHLPNQCTRYATLKVKRKDPRTGEYRTIYVCRDCYMRKRDELLEGRT